MRTEDIRYWANIEISLDDLEQIEKTPDKLVRRLYNRLKGDDDWFQLIQDVFHTKGNDLEEALAEISDRNFDDFLSLFAVSEFGRGLIDPDIVYSRALAYLPEYRRKIELKKVRHDALLLPMFKKNRESLIHVYYDMIVHNTNLRKYTAENKIDAKNFLQSIKADEMDSLLSKARKSNIIKRAVKVWMIRKNEEKVQVFFRVERKTLKPIKLLNSNDFIRTALLRVFIFSDKGNSLEVFARGEPDRTAKLASFIISGSIGKGVKYDSVSQNFETAKLAAFVSKAISKEIPEIKILEIERRNAPLPTSPIIIIKSAHLDSIDEPIKVLREQYGIDLTSNVNDIAGLVVKLNGQIFRIKLKPDNDSTEILLNTRNIREEQKNVIFDFLDKNVA